MDTVNDMNMVCSKIMPKLGPFRRFISEKAWGSLGAPARVCVFEGLRGFLGEYHLNKENQQTIWPDN